MMYKMITNVGKVGARLAGAAFRHRDLIVSSLLERWRGRLPEGEKFEALHLILTLIGEDLEESHNQLVESENSLRSELREDKQDRRVRNRAYSDLRELLLHSKQLIDVMFGPGEVEAIFEEDDVEIPIDPDPLYRLRARVRNNLTSPTFPLPELRRDLGKFALEFDAPLADLRQSMRSLQWGLHGSSQALASKERKLFAEQREAILGARVLEAITAYAGHEDIAKRIRLSRHQARQVEEVEAPEEPAAQPAAEASDEAPAAESPRSEGADAAPASGDAGPAPDPESASPQAQGETPAEAAS